MRSPQQLLGWFLLEYLRETGTIDYFPGMSDSDFVAAIPDKLISDFRERWNEEALHQMEERTCHDCGAAEGQYHDPGCDMERCPFCGGQLISCGCSYKHLNINVEPGTPGFDEDVYNNGLTDEHAELWELILREKGLVPYIAPMNLCARCGQQWPLMFNDPEWDKYVVPELRAKMLCHACFNHMKQVMPNGWRNATPSKSGTKG